MEEIDAMGMYEDFQALEEENEELRKLLAFNYSGTALYADDGELRDNRRHPPIDFKRDSVDEIKQKMMIRAAADA